MKHLQFILACALSASAAAASPKLLQSCDAGNSECFERNHETACADPSASIDTCKAWLRILEPQAKGGVRYASLMIGHAYKSLAVLSSDPQEAKAYRERAVDVFRELSERDSTDAKGIPEAQAMMALAALTEDRAERIRLLESAIALSPDIFAMRSLASELRQRGRAGDTLEAARLMEEAYARQTNDNRWYLASAAFGLYQDAGAPDRAVQLQRRVRKELGVVELTSVPADADASEISCMLSAACNGYALPVIGAGDCLRSTGNVIQQLVRNRLSGGDEHANAQELANSAVEAMVEATRSESALDKEYPDWQETYRLRLENLLDNGFESSAIQTAYATVTTGDKRLHALERAAELAPKDGAAAFRLGMEYGEHGKWKEAVVELQRAKELLPAPQNQAVEHNLQVASRKVTETEEARP